MVAWKLRQFEFNDQDSLIELYQTVFNGWHTKKYWKWKYLQNPSGFNRDIWVAFDKEKIVGAYSLIPTFMQICGEKCLCAQSVDTATHPDYRKQRIFISLAEKVYKNAVNNRIILTYGFPNKASVYGFLKTLNFTDISNSAVEMLKLLNVDNVLNDRISNPLLRISGKLYCKIKRVSKYKSVGIPGNSEILHNEKFGIEWEKLWEKIYPFFDIVVDRSSEYLNWRYFNHPEIKYNVFKIKIKQKLIGYIILSESKIGNFTCGNLMDLMYDQTVPKSIDMLISLGINYFKEKKMDIIRCWTRFNNKLCNQLKFFGFIPRPRFKLYMWQYINNINKLNLEMKNAVQNYKRKWFFSLGDGDIV